MINLGKTAILIWIPIVLFCGIVLAMEEQYLDKTLPREIPVAPYPGERYEAVVPDTLDLVDHANLAINALT